MGLVCSKNSGSLAGQEMFVSVSGSFQENNSSNLS